MSIFKKLFGIDKIEAAREEALRQFKEVESQKLKAIEEAEQLKAEAEAAVDEAVKEAELAKLSLKERATRKKEPYIAVLDTKVNPDNIRNGFFELDWNEYFIVQLKQEGYGFEGDPDEEIVDRWFRDIIRQMLGDEGLDTNRGAGYINVVPLEKGKSEVS